MHITRRNGVYYFRKKVPVDLVAEYGKREIIYSLRTRERPIAARLALRAAVQLDDEFSLKRGEPVPGHFAALMPRPSASMNTDGAGPTPAITKRSATKLSGIISIWRRDRQPTAKTVDAMARAVREANDPDIHAITRQSIVAMRDRWIEAGNSIATTNKKLGFIRLLLGIAKGRGMIESNPAEGAELPPPKRAVELRKPYTPRQAQTVLDATARMRDSDPAMYWLPRLAKWTGARLNELHQLRRCDLIVRDGVRGIRITDEGEHASSIPMTLKNALVPLHWVLSDFWTWAEALPDGPLLPVRADKYGNVSAAFSKRYGKLLRSVCKIEDKDIAFHTRRHLFADKCRAAGVAVDVRMALMGHSEGGAAGTYGAVEALPVRVLSAAVGKLSSGDVIFGNG